jgi:predicted TIM-barrel fold metal-dependent hydrolase
VELRQRHRADPRYKVPWRDVNQTLKNIKVEVELGFDPATAWKEAQRCLNCDVQTVFTRSCASSATPASTSARWLHHLHRTARRPTCGRG